MSEIPTYHSTWCGRPLLQGTGCVSHEDAMEKALAEYRKYQVKTLSPVEQAYIDNIKMLSKKGKRNTRDKNSKE